MKDFPSGEWVFGGAKVIGRLRYDRRTRSAVVIPMTEVASWWSTGTYSMEEYPVTGLKTQGPRIRGDYAKVPGPDGKTYSGSFRGILRGDASMGFEVSTAVNGPMTPYVGTLLPGTIPYDKRAAGRRCDVMFIAGGASVSVAAGVSGVLIVRDLDACWERNYNVAGGGLGASAGFTFPSATEWERNVSLHPPCENWVGGTMGMYTHGIQAGIGGVQTFLVRFSLPGGADFRVNWSGWSFAIGAQVDTGTFVVAKILGIAKEGPYFPGL